MIFDNCNPFLKSGKSSEEARICIYWYNRLWNIVMSLYDWKGSPFEGNMATCNRDYLEWALLTRGFATFIKDKSKKLRSIDCTKIGIDPYNFPTNIEVVNPILGNIKGIVNQNCVFVRNNKFAMPVISTIKYYAEQLAKVQISLNVSLSNNRMTKIFNAESDQQAQQIRKMVDDIDRGELAVIVKKNIFENIMNNSAMNKVPVYSTPSEYLADKFLQNIRTILNEFLIVFGVNASGGNIIKSQYNAIDDINSNNQEILINRDYWLKPRQEAAEIASELFDTEISVDLAYSDYEEVLLNDLQKSEFGNQQSTNLSQS